MFVTLQIWAKNKRFYINLVQGEWTSPYNYLDLVDPLRGGTMVKIPDTQMSEIEPFVESLQ